MESTTDTIGQSNLLETTRNPEKFTLLWDQCIARLSKETQLFDLLESLNYLSIVHDPLSAQDIRWNQTSLTELGVFDVVTGNVEVSVSPPSRESILLSILKTGKFPLPLDAASHEIIHKKQYPAAIITRLFRFALQNADTNDSLSIGHEFDEVVAYRLTVCEADEMSPEDLAQFLMTAEDDKGKIYPTFDESQVKSAIDAVDSLLALGCPLHEIIQMSSKKLSDVTDKVQELCNLKGINTPEQLDLLKQNYKDAKKADKALAQKIILEEMAKLEKEA